MNWLESIIYALISGVAELLPVSSKAHQSIMLTLFGCSGGTPLLDLIIHIAALAAVYMNCRSAIAAINRTQKLLSIPKRRRKRQPDWNLVADLRLIKTAAVPMLLSVLLTKAAASVSFQLQVIAFTLALNGVLLYVIGHTPIGNKTAASMNRFESLLIGLASGFGILPGLSRMGAGLSVSILRGAEPQRALHWTLILSIPMLFVLCIADIIGMFTGSLGAFGFWMLIQCMVSGVFAYIGASLALALLRFLAVKGGFSLFSYYCWGMALLAFILFMI